MRLPSYQSSPDEISAQVSDLGRKTNAAPSSSSTASRASSSKNFIADTSASTVGAARPDGNLRLGEVAEPRGVSATAIPPDPAIGAAQADAAEAAAGVGQPETLDALAKDLGVDPETGAFAEEVDIDQLRAEGQLSADQ